MIALMIVIILVLALSYICYRLAFYSRPGTQGSIYAFPAGEQYEEKRHELTEMIREFEALPFEQVYTLSHDGLRLAARYYHVRDGAPLQIQCHGYRGSGLRDFSGGSRLARKLGHNILLIDQRAHGLSQGHSISFGLNEHRDCLSWVNYAIERFGPQLEIILCGVSMGASTVIMAGSSEPPANVKGIIADCPFSVCKDIISITARSKMHLSPAPVWPFIRLGALLFGRFDPVKADALKAVKSCRLPILLIHGEGDRFVPFEMSRQLFEACPSEKFFLAVPEAGHGMSYLFDREAYEQHTKDFLDLCKVEYLN